MEGDFVSEKEKRKNVTYKHTHTEKPVLKKTTTGNKTRFPIKELNRYVNLIKDKIIRPQDIIKGEITGLRKK